MGGSTGWSVVDVEDGHVVAGRALARERERITASLTPVQLTRGNANGEAISFGCLSLESVTPGILEDLAREDYIYIHCRGGIKIPPLRFKRLAEPSGKDIRLAVLCFEIDRVPYGGLIRGRVAHLPGFCSGDLYQVQNTYVGQTFFEQESVHFYKIPVCLIGLLQNKLKGYG